MKVSVELREQHPNGKIGFDHIKRTVMVDAKSHTEARSIAESKHKALVLSTEKIAE